MNNAEIIQLLKDNFIINDKCSILARYEHKINVKCPSLLDILNDRCKFLKYEACLKTKILVVINNITEQQFCKKCNNILKILLVPNTTSKAGSFPSYCCKKCCNTAPEILHLKCLLTVKILKLYGT